MRRLYQRRHSKQHDFTLVSWTRYRWLRPVILRDRDPPYASLASAHDFYMIRYHYLVLHYSDLPALTTGVW